MAVDEVCQDARRLLSCHNQPDCLFTVDLLLREFLNNAIIHGNRLDARKRAQVEVRIGQNWIVLRVADEGSGFDWWALSRAPPDENALCGRGLAIGAQYAQRMRFNRVGNQVTLWVRLVVEQNR